MRSRRLWNEVRTPDSSRHWPPERRLRPPRGLAAPRQSRATPERTDVLSRISQLSIPLRQDRTVQKGEKKNAARQTLSLHH